MPSPVGLVVKNGSKMCSCTSALMPVPVSWTAITTHGPGAMLVFRLLPPPG